ncbi:MAG TPA: VWA domain-containing protein [Vicinamibacterales bacterium]|nr:VWA domain-containing protein [Vicinamibacterales bacterium]
MRSSVLRYALIIATVVVAATATSTSPSAQQQPVFRSRLNLVSVDVIVRDKSGAVVRNLTASDFEVREDGKAQEITNFNFEEITDNAVPALQSADLLAGVEQKLAEDSKRAASPTTATARPVENPSPMTSDMLAGRRLITIVFDVSSMQPEDVQRAVDSAHKYVEEKMSPADLVAVATVGSTLSVVTDFTADRAKVASALSTIAYTDGTATPTAAASTAATDETQATATDDTTVADTAELDMFNNDVRLRALKTLAEALSPIEQKKSILYFSAGMQRSGQDNQVELRSAINAAVRANVAIYAIDTRGLQAVVPGGDARQASGRGQSLFSGRGVQQQFDQLASSQETLTTLASDTGGRAFTDSNDFGEAFARVQRDMSAYYLLGYSSTNTTKDGRFRRIQVRVKRDGMRVEARAGYYAERDFGHTSRNDRESQLQEQMFAAVSATDLPVLVTGGWFRLAPDKYYVPVSLTVPGSAVPVLNANDFVSLDVLGMVRDERNFPVGRFRETLKLPPGTEKTLAGKQVLYQSGVTLPPGRFSVKVVVRENATGLIGSFEAPIVVPELKQAPMKVSSVVLSTQLQSVTMKGKTDNPLIRDGVQLLPNLTHVVGKDQKLFFYYEVYDPGQANGATPELRTSLAFYRGKVKVFETPVVERTAIDAPDRHAALFQFEVPASSFAPGLYTCQINIIDAVSGKFDFPRMLFAVR